MSVNPNVSLEDVFSFFVKHVNPGPTEEVDSKPKKKKLKGNLLEGYACLLNLALEQLFSGHITFTVG